MSKEADNTKNKYGQNPFCFYCCSDNLDIKIIKKFLENNNDTINMSDSAQMTPLHWVCLSENINPVIIEFLLEKGADANSKDKYGRTPLQCIFDNKNDNTTENITAAIKILEKYKSSPENVLTYTK